MTTDAEEAVRLETEPHLDTGDTGEAVAELHEALAAAGFPVDTPAALVADDEPLPPAVFDDATAAAVRAFQEANGLTVDGTATEETWSALSGAAIPRATTISGRGTKFIAGWEGFSGRLYNDPGGHCTIGYGHLVHLGNCNGSEPAEFKAGITRERGLQLLNKEAKQFAALVDKAVTVGINQAQLDALTSFAFNVGGKAFRDSTLLRLLNQGRYDTVPGQLMRWVYSSGKPLEGLRRRRRAEGELFAQGDYGGGTGTGTGGGGGGAPTGMSVREVQRTLREIGWPVKVDGAFGDQTHNATRDFQRGFAFWALSVDGDPGPKTQEALRHSAAQGGRCSPNFLFREFKSRGNGWIKVSRALVKGLEDYRDLVGGPVQVISGYRDPAYNAGIPGAAKNSQHVYGNAADIGAVVGRREVARLRRFSGIGYQASTGRVRHVDVRHVGPNTTGNTVDNPAQWPYGAGLLPEEDESEELTF